MTIYHEYFIQTSTGGSGYLFAENEKHARQSFAMFETGATIDFIECTDDTAVILTPAVNQ